MQNKLNLNFKSIFTVSLVFLSVLFVLGSFNTANAQTFQFTKNLYLNMTPSPNDDVRQLQTFLKNLGYYSGSITGVYSNETFEAVKVFQNANGITPPSGYFGLATRNAANKILSSGSVTMTATAQTTTAPTTAKTTSVVSTTTQTSTTNTTSSSMINLVPNASLEVANGSVPLNWAMGKWGTNTTTFSYPTSGQDGTRAAKVQMTSYSSGDAKWYFYDASVTPGVTYTFSEYYKSNVVTNVTIRWTKTDGTNAYQSLGNPAIATNWTNKTYTFTVPASVKSMTVFHVLKSVGTLEIDNYKLTSGVGATTTLVPIDATVSDWSAWVAVSPWSTCLNGSQSRTEERTRTVLTSALNGGVTPSLKELRTVTQTCTTNTSSTGGFPVVATTSSNTSTLNFPVKEWGAYVGWQETAMDTFESAVGKQAKHRAVFIHWGNESAFPMYLKPYVKERGKTMVIFWEATNYVVGTVNQTAYNYDSILAGNFDSYFTKFAADAKTYGGDVILIPFSEMNGDWFPWAITQNGNTPQKHVDAWRKIHGFFRDATNVKFGWAPNHYSVPEITINQFENFYPGDAYVDYVGLDGFNFGSPWMTFDQIFSTSLAKMKLYKKPIFIFSFASASGTNKPAWITDALTTQMAKHPEIKGWIWFNESKERDWRVTADASALNAFKTALP